VRFRIKIFLLAFLGGVAFAPSELAAPGTPAASPTLRSLAFQAQEPGGWAALRRFAVKAEGPDEKSLAYFVLGYREFQAERYREAEHDLERSAVAESPLADFAEFYRAAALRAGGRPREAAGLIADFRGRHPQSALRAEALALGAQCLTDSGEPERAIQALAMEPSVEENSSLLLARARALERVGRSEEAVECFEQVYCLFPTSGEAAEAGRELAKLRAAPAFAGRARFREPSPELLTTRAETLLARERRREALHSFNTALETYPESPNVPQWKVGRAKCLLGLRRSEEALDGLQWPYGADPAMDSERLATLVDAYAQRGNPESMRLIIEQLGAVYPKSDAFAQALARAGSYYRRMSDWKSAESFDEKLANAFGNKPEAEEARWQLGWMAYLERRDDKARSAWVSYVSQNTTARHVPDALYWLGRLAESSGATVEADTLYKTLANRYPHNYFGGRAAERLKASTPKPGGEPQDLSRNWASVAGLTSLIPLAPPPPPWLCSIRPSDTDRALDAVVLLESLSLTELAETYLKSVLSGRMAAPELYMALGRIEAQQGEVARSLLAVGKAFPRYEEYDFSRTPRGFWDLLFPRPFWEMVRQESGARGLDPYLVMGLIRQESAFNPNAVSSANARGLMQILPGTLSPRRSGRRLAARRLANASYNLRFGSSYLEQLFRDYNGVPEYALAAYHAGKGHVDDWLAKNTFQEPAEFMESIPIPATRIYVEHVLRDTRVYHDLMAADPAFRRCP
jgi:peptidoglycan lytic transglycosylase